MAAMRTTGFSSTARPTNAAYLGDWLRILRADPRALVAACGHAQRSVDLLNERAGWIATHEETLVDDMPLSA
jgi:antirestriction protein ArdC